MDSRTRLTVSPDLLARAGANAGLAPEVTTRLWGELATLAPRNRFGVANVAFYFGAMVIISAMTWFMTSSWDETSGQFKTVAALIYAAVFAVGSYLFGRGGARIPAGLLATAAVCMAPLAVYGIESAANFRTEGYSGTYGNVYDYLRSSDLPMELATIVAGLATIGFVRFPFMVAPIAFAAWFASMDIAPLFAHDRYGYASWDERAMISTAFGLVFIVGALIVDLLTREDYAFWLYLFGSLSFWGGIWVTSNGWSGNLQVAVLPIGLAFIAASLILGRRVLAVFGSLGCFGFIAHLAWRFQDSLSFPVALTLGGLGVIGLGYVYQQNLARIEAALDEALPPSVKRLIPRSRLS